MDAFERTLSELLQLTANTVTRDAGALARILTRAHIKNGVPGSTPGTLPEQAASLEGATAMNTSIPNPQPPHDNIVTDLALRARERETAAQQHARDAEQHQTTARRLHEQAEDAASTARQLRSLVAILDGGAAPLAPGDITSDDVLGLHVGPLPICPPDGASVADLRLYLGTVRALYEQALHQSRLVAEEIRRREGQATQATAEVDPNDLPDPPGPRYPSSTCAHCQQRIVLVGGWWVHDYSRDDACQPGTETSPWATPVEQAHTDPDGDLAPEIREDDRRDYVHIGPNVLAPLPPEPQQPELHAADHLTGPYPDRPAVPTGPDDQPLPRRTRVPAEEMLRAAGGQLTPGIGDALLTGLHALDQAHTDQDGDGSDG